MSSTASLRDITHGAPAAEAAPASTASPKARPPHTHDGTIRRPVRLERNNLLRIVGGEGVQVTTASGVLWVTEEGSANDTFVEPGNTVRIEHPGLAVVLAQRAARVVLEIPAGTPEPTHVEIADAPGEPGRRLRFPGLSGHSLRVWIRAIGATVGGLLAAAQGLRRALAGGSAAGALSRPVPHPYY